MKRIIQIWKRDLKAVLQNYAALIVIVVLCIVPSLFAWLNISGSFHSQQNGKMTGIKIGVVNLDQGVVFGDKVIRIGDTFVERLSKDEQLGWQFVNQETAKEEIEFGNYYAVITITEDFSKNLMSITGNDVTKGRLIYTVNEKNNGITLIRADQGVTSLVEKVSKTVDQIVSSILLEVVQEVGIHLEEQIPNLTTAYEKLQAILANYDEVHQTIEDTNAGVNQLDTLIHQVLEERFEVESILAQVVQFDKQLKEYWSMEQEKADQIIPQMKRDLELIAGVSNEVTLQAQVIQTWLESETKDSQDLLDQLEAKLKTIQMMTDSMNKVLSGMNELSRKGSLNELISQLSKVNDAINRPIEVIHRISQQLTQGETPDLTMLPEMNQVCKSIQNKLEQMVTSYDQNVANKIANLFRIEQGIVEDRKDRLSSLTEGLLEVNNLLLVAQKSVKTGKEGMSSVREIITEAQWKIEEFTRTLAEVNEDGGLLKLSELLKADVTSRTDFFAQPVEFVEETLYPMQDYKTQITPFNTVLSIWLTVLLSVSMLSVKTEGETNFLQEFFGKIMIFLVISILQTLIVTLGDLWILRIYCKNPLLFIVANVITSVVFTTIVYTLVSVLRNAGKVIVILFLVLFMTSGSSMFLIQQTPTFYEYVQSWLPFTYAISMNREAIGGVVYAVMLKDVIFLCVYVTLTLILLIRLKRPIHRMLSGLLNKFHNSHLFKGFEE